MMEKFTGFGQALQVKRRNESYGRESDLPVIF